MRRRDFITLLGGAGAWPLTAHAQQVPTVGFVYTGEQEGTIFVQESFKQGLLDVGFIEGQNVLVEYRWSGGQQDQLRTFVAEFVRREVAVIAGNTPGAMAAKSATSTIPIVFVTGSDPLTLGLVASFNRPGGNVTGVTFLTIALEAKRLGLLHDLLPQATAVAALVDPSSPDSATQLKNVNEAIRLLGRQISIFQASTQAELNEAFVGLAHQRSDALLVVPTPFFTSQRRQIVELTAQHSLPAIYGFREFPAAGGLMSYGASLGDAFRQAGSYAGRILKGERPADIPVLQPTKFEFVINLRTAKALRLTFPPGLLAIADEVIE
jgi:putative ABC transport system substrate-binding protein